MSSRYALAAIALTAAFASPLRLRAEPVILKDVVLVPDAQPFYIQLFETTSAEALAAVPESTKNRASVKAARLTSVKVGEAICAHAGMRLPTRKEWLAAASNVGKNQLWSLRGDSLVDKITGKTLANIAQGTDESYPVNDIEHLGLDAIGTVGMTGNRAEYYQEGANWGACGQEFETLASELAQLSRTCEEAWKKSATVRCVKDYSDEIRVELSDRVSPEHRKYPEEQSVTTPGKNGNPRFRPDLGDGPLSERLIHRDGRDAKLSDEERLAPRDPLSGGR